MCGARPRISSWLDISNASRNCIWKWYPRYAGSIVNAMRAGEAREYSLQLPPSLSPSSAVPRATSPARRRARCR